MVHFLRTCCTFVALLSLLHRTAVAVDLSTTERQLLNTRVTPPISPVNVDAVTCSIEDCALMCICQKLLWIIDYNHPDAAEPTDQICVKWANTPKLMAKSKKGEECLTGCLVIAQYIDAAGGRDPNM